jgi:hypothetical protein
LVPLGAVSKELIDHLVGYYKDEYGLTVRVLPPIRSNMSRPEDTTAR